MDSAEEPWLRDPDDGWNYVRGWMHEVGIEKADEDPPWAVACPLTRHLSDEQIVEIIGGDRLHAFWDRAWREVADRVVRRLRATGLRWERVEDLDQANALQQKLEQLDD